MAHGSVGATLADPDPGPGVQRVIREHVIAAMEAEQGYDPTKTTNAALFQGSVLLRLVAQADSGAHALPLFIDHEDWYRAFLQRVSLEEDEAPLYARLAYEHHQDLWVECGVERVVKKVVRGPRPTLAANVSAGWPPNQKPDSFTYDDELSVPKLRARVSRVVRYRLLEVDGMVVYDDIHGVKGRPTSGFLGMLFKLMGEGRIVFSRLTRAPDGLQIGYARAKKAFFSVTSTVTVTPDGIVTKGLPPERDDLKKIEERVQQKLKYDYVPWGGRGPRWLELQEH